ncbi:MAG: T9SS type A sorting domain-containing protein [Bacteroidales bacterium]|nr:T9SS type A sorting domain-containing protein [Bacteroidales bacterium]
MANDSIIWGGAGMFNSPDLRIFRFKDYADSISVFETSMYNTAELGFISGMATHPKDENTAFVLFSFKEKPKILRTTNGGKSWDDISGFHGNDTSNNGFPDVMVHSLLVLPTDSFTLWAGTEIGLFESADDGQTWHYANNGLPSVSVFDMKVIDNQIVVATHGRGIWTLDLPSLIQQESEQVIDKQDKQPAIDNSKELMVYPNPVNGGVANVVMKFAEKGRAEVRMVGIDGKIYSTWVLNKDKADFETEINTSQLKKGNYLLTVVTKKRDYSQHVIIK